MNTMRAARATTVLAAIVTAAAAAILADRFNGDALIYLPFARNAAQGDLFAFNPHVFSSGSTSPLWPLILAPAFWFGDGVIASKIIAYVVLAFALWDTHRTALRISDSRLSAACALVVVAFLLANPGALMYESALVVIGVNALIRIPCDEKTDEGNRIGNTTMCAVVWMVMPFIRPDAAVLAVISAAVVVGKQYGRGERRKAAATMALFIAASIPYAIYAWHSFELLGVISASAASRSFAFQEGARYLFGTSYSFETLFYLMRPPMIVAVFAAAWGWWISRKHESLRALRRVALVAVPGYVVSVTFVDPITASAGRYLVLVSPLIGVFAGIGCEQLLRASAARGLRWERAASVGGAMIMLFTCGMMIRNAVKERAFCHTYANATDVTLAEYVNDHAPAGATLLAYDVQVRTRLRADLRTLDLDGLTDGAVIPYFNNMTAFLHRYRPNYFASNVAMYRPYLASSVLGDVVSHTPDSVGAMIEREGMRFTILQTHALPDLPEIGTWRRLYTIAYLP